MVTQSSSAAGSATKTKLLAAATQAFVAFGPAGARVDAIAEAAGVNKRMLYHHFGDKQGLYLAVLAAADLEDGPVSGDRARLLAWEGLVAAPPANQRKTLALGGSTPEPGADISPVPEGTGEQHLDARLYALLQKALQVFPHVFGPELERITGLAPGSPDCEAALARLAEQVQQRMDPKARVQVAKTKVRLRAQSRPRVKS